MKILKRLYLFAFEDLRFADLWGSDYDYQDFAFIITNIAMNPSGTPEPATMLIFGLGIAGVAAA